MTQKNKLALRLMKQARINRRNFMKSKPEYEVTTDLDVGTLTTGFNILGENKPHTWLEPEQHAELELLESYLDRGNGKPILAINTDRIKQSLIDKISNGAWDVACSN